MKKVLALGASNSKYSINEQLAVFAASSLAHAESSIADLNDYELPMYSVDLQREIGVHKYAHLFYKLIQKNKFQTYLNIIPSH